MLSCVVRAHQTKAPVGKLRAARPYFLAVDEVVVAFVHGLRAKRGEVGARARLGIALAPAHRAVDNARQVAALLLVVTVLEKSRTEHRGAHAADRIEGADTIHFLIENARLRLG